VVGSGNMRDCISFILCLAASGLNYTEFYDSGDLLLHVWGFLFYMSLMEMNVDLCIYRQNLQSSSVYYKNEHIYPVWELGQKSFTYSNDLSVYSIQNLF
jgi:hypothetical protein